MTIRSLRVEEWRTYRAVRLAALADAPDAFGGTYDAALAYPEQLWRDWCGQPSWFAFAGDEPVGMVRIARADDRDLPELISMWVAPAARGTSVAADLIGCVLTWARAGGDHGVRLHVIESNLRARALYRRMGFVENEIREQLPNGRVELEAEMIFDR
ncbi:GNAT family N-acetyltransferase [Rudaeicoccus suwonensis]|uniref:GNAT family N-acetyltransferase n=1 Tax=Rudaeicoccus suwonensis TaxID=657409 RepID=UPI001477039C|nr:GNAT family N-acetyltransferase [Rudaeicoccus suwonensis]